MSSAASSRLERVACGAAVPEPKEARSHAADSHGRRSTCHTPQRMNENYGAAENWFGSYYELAIEVSTAPADERLRASIEQLWSCTAVVAGPWLDKEVTRAVAVPRLPAVEGMAASYGIVHIPDLGDVRCVSWVIREVGCGSDWIDLCIPTSALEPFGLAYPLVSETPCTLIDAIDRALLHVAVSVFAGAPFELALIGEEVSGMWSSATVTRHDLTQGGFLLPDKLAQQTGACPQAEIVAPGLWWVANRCEERFDKVSER